MRPQSGVWSLAISRRLRLIGGACFSRISGAAGLNKNVPPNRRQFALVNHCKQMGAQMNKNVPPNRRQFALVNHCKQMGAQMSLPGERSSPKPPVEELVVVIVVPVVVW